MARFNALGLALSLSVSLLAVGTTLPQAFAAPQRGVAADKALSLNIATKGNELAFDKTKFSAKPGQSIKLTFTNKAAAGSNLQHNWVLVNPGTADAVGQASLGAGPAKGYLAESADVLAHTKLLDPGAKDTIEFKAPQKPGDYPFICTFPGHYTMMKGVLTVK